jgi:biopolymer transport protein ExbD
MAIYAPGRRGRGNRPLKNGKRSTVMHLSLTAMVDMFTVLTVFLLQNYNTTGEVIELSDQVELPKATRIKEIEPSHVVVVSKEGIFLDKVMIISTAKVKASNEVVLPALQEKIKEMFQKEEQKGKAAIGVFNQAVQESKPLETRAKPKDYRKLTIQADRKVEYGIVRKVMFTLMEAGASETNFAVLKEDNKPKIN